MTTVITTIKDLVIHVVETDEGVAVDIYGIEDDTKPITGTWAMFDDPLTREELEDA